MSMGWLLMETFVGVGRFNDGAVVYTVRARLVWSCLDFLNMQADYLVRS